MIVSHDSLEVTPIEMKPEKEKKYCTGLRDSVKRALRERADLESKAKVAVLQYHSCLKREDAEETEAQLDVPSTRQFIEMAIARFMNPIFQRNEVYLAKPRRPQFQDFAQEIEEFAAWMISRRSVQFRRFVEQVLKQAFVFPKAVAKIPFTVKSKRIKQYYHEVQLAPGMTASEGAFEVSGTLEEGLVEKHWGVRDNDEIRTISMNQVVESGPFPEVVPWADFIHPLQIANIQDAPWVAHRVWKSKDDLRRDIHHGVYRSKTKDGQDILKVIGDPQKGPDKDLNLSLTKGESSADKYGNSADAEAGEDGKLFEVLEIYTTLDEEEVIVTLEMETATVLRFVENFYMEDQRPFVVWNYEAVLNDVDGVSLCYILEPYHRALSAILNQRLDAASKAMENLIFFSESLDLGKYLKNGKLLAGAYPVNSVQDLGKQVAQFNLSQPYSQIESLEATIKQDMQMLASLTAYNAGVEQIQRPTATGQVALIEEGRQPQYNRMESFRNFLTEVGEMMIARYRQFYPVDITFYLETRKPEEQQLLHRTMKWPVQYWRDQIFLEPKVSSQQLSSDLRKQEWLALVDKLPQVFQQLMGMLQPVLDASPASPAAAKIFTFFVNYVVQPWLEEFGVAGREFLTFDEETQVGQKFQEVMGELQGQIEQMGQELQAKDGQLFESARTVDHLTRQFVNVTGRVPPPPPAGKSRPPGPAEAPPGMGGGPGVPGGAGGPPMG